MTKLYVGRISEEVTEANLRSLFAPHVVTIQMMRDDTSKRFRGFALVDVHGDPSGAIDQVNGKELYGRSVVVKAMP